MTSTFYFTEWNYRVTGKALKYFELYVFNSKECVYPTPTDNILLPQHPSYKNSDTENFSVNVDVDDEDELSTDDDDDVSSPKYRGGMIAQKPQYDFWHNNDKRILYIILLSGLV